MRSLMLLRHAKTERDSPTGRDRDRRLDERGRHDATQMGLWLASLPDLKPDLILVSTAVRTRQTYDLLPGALRDCPAEHRDDLYAAETGDLLSAVQLADDSKPHVLVIAHNPGLHELALALGADGNAAARRELEHHLPTSGFVAISFADDAWTDIGFRRGRLDLFMSPKLLRERGEP